MWDVEWVPVAEARLAAIWNVATDRADVTAAANQIDTALRRDPLGVGEGRAAPTRILIESPLAVYYDVDPVGRTVTVSDVWRVA